MPRRSVRRSGKRSSSSRRHRRRLRRYRAQDELSTALARLSFDVMQQSTPTTEDDRGPSTTRSLSTSVADDSQPTVAIRSSSETSSFPPAPIRSSSTSTHATISGDTGVSMTATDPAAPSRQISFMTSSLDDHYITVPDLNRFNYRHRPRERRSSLTNRPRSRSPARPRSRSPHRPRDV